MYRTVKSKDLGRTRGRLAMVFQSGGQLENDHGQTF